MNLFAKFELKAARVDDEIVDDSGMGFVSPEASRFLGRKDVGSASRKGNVSSAASKTRVINIADDDEFVRQVERVEEKLMSESGKGESSKTEEDDSCNLATDEEDNLEMDEIPLRPRGYDKEFWSPLLKGDFGGSDAVNVVFNEDEIVEGLTKKKGPRTYFCDT